MIVEKTHLEGCCIIKPTVFEDQRGYFFESFNRKRFEQATGLDIDFVQDNQSKSSRGVLRGLHFQQGEFAQAKLVRVMQGAVLDIVVDIRKDSPTFGQHFSLLLSGQNKVSLFIPRGFAHGFAVLEDETIFTYKCDNYYNKASESGILYNDPSLQIDWMLDDHEVLLSDKDKLLPSWSQFVESLN